MFHNTNISHVFMHVYITHLDHDVVTGSRLLGFIHPTLHHVVAHLHHVLNTHRERITHRKGYDIIMM